MDLLAHVAQLTGEQHLHLRVYIFDIVFDHEFATLCQVVDVLQLCQQLCEFVFLEQSDTLEHGDMGHRAQYIVFRQIEIHLAVTPHRKPLNLLIDLKVLLPKLHIHLFILPS